MTAAAPLPAQIDALRRFNRFYTRWLGLLDEHLLASEFTLTETRVLYELAHRVDASAAELARELAIDAGYLSRLLKAFDARGLLKKAASAQDARQQRLSLSAAGRAAFAPLNRASKAQLARQLKPLRPRQVAEVVGAMRRIEALLSPAAAEPPAAFILRPHQVGDIGWVAHRQGLLYAQEYGWDASFEALVAQIAAQFVQRFDAERERCWIAERDGQIIGSVFVVKQSARVAKLRLLYVEPSARGLGLGGRLVDECIRFARERGYRRLTLWTNQGLEAARNIYVARGFQLVKEERHHSFGKDQIGQHWNLDMQNLPNMRGANIGEWVEFDSAGRGHPLTPRTTT